MTIFRLLDFEVDRHLTLEIDRTRVFGKVVVTYAVRATPAGSRIIVKLNVRIGWPLRWILPAGDWIMMRKQLLTLKHYAERDCMSHATCGGQSI